MSQALSFARNAMIRMPLRQRDVASSAIVLACAAALILAGQPLPY